MPREQEPDLSSLNLPPIPKGWGYVRLDDLLEPDGLSYGIVQPGSDDAEGVPVLRVKDLQNRIQTDDVIRVSPEVERQYRRSRLKGGEVLLSLVGSVGTVAIAPLHVSGWNVARAIAVIRVRDQASLWVRYYLSSDVAQHYMHVWKTTTVQATLNLRDVRRLPIAFPPRLERDAIVTLLAALDDKIAVNDRIAHHCHDLAEILFRSETLASPRAALSSLIEPILGGTPDRAMPEYWGPGHPWASAKDVAASQFGTLVATEEEITDLAATQTKAKPVAKGSVILTARGTVGAVARVAQPTALNQSCYAFVPSLIPPGILYLMIRAAAQQMLGVAHGTVFSTVNMKTFDHIQVPSLSESDLKRLEGEVVPFLDLIEARVRENRSLSNLRHVLLPGLMSGEIRVREAERIVEDAT